MKLFKKLMLFLLPMLCLFTPTLLHAQPEDPCTDPFDPCPIDDGVIYLIVVVIAIAGYKFIHSTKKISF
jgi:hypothetical protein